MNKKQKHKEKEDRQCDIFPQRSGGRRNKQNGQMGRIIDVHKSQVERGQPCINQPMASKDPRTDESVMVATTEHPQEFQE